MLEERLIDLETRLAYQERALEDLGDTLTRQSKRIEQLEQRCRLLAERLLSLAPGEGGVPATAAEERPPHY